MYTSILRVLCVFALIFSISANVQAQIQTTTYNDKLVKSNSIVVKYDNTFTGIKGKSVDPLVLLNDYRAKASGAVVTTRLNNQNVEEWQISGDIKTTLRELNAIPGVTAFPNYVFEREDLKPEAIDQASVGSSNYTRIPLSEKIGSLSTTGAVVNTFEFDPTVYFQNFDDSAEVADHFNAIDYDSSGVNWNRVPDDFNGGWKMELKNLTGTDTLVNAELVGPSFDLTDMDTTESLVFSADLYFEHFSDSMVTYVWFNKNTGGYGLSGGLGGNLGEDFSWDISEFIGDTLTITFQVVDYNMVPDQAVLMNVDNFEITNFPTDDEFLFLQYALNNDGSFRPGYSVPGADVSAFNAWNETTGSDEVVVVVYDDGVDFYHPDLMNQAWVNPGEDLNGDGFVSGDEWNGVDDDGNGYVDDFWGWSAVYDDNSFINPGSFHGTHVAGIIGAEGNNGIGVSGVSQNVSMISVMIFNEFGRTDAISIMRGYDYISTLLADGVDIVAVNQSWGGGRYLDLESDQQYIDVMTQYAWDHASYGTAWVVSAGNSARDRDEVPFYSIPNNIQAPNIITVASTDDADNKSGFSDFGVRTVDIGAPGSFIASTLPGGYAYLSGTSMAAPQVAGAMALAKSLYPDESGMDIMVRVLAGADYMDQFDGVFGEGGRLNAFNTVSGEAFESGLLASHGTATFHRTYIDGEAYTAVGFVNNTDADVNVTGITISGTNADAFSADGFEAKTIPAGGAYSVAVAFNNDGSLEELTATATIATSGGDVEIALNGREQGFASAEISPSFADIGPIPYGTPVEAEFTVTNTGTGEYQFFVEQFLYATDFEYSEYLDALSTFTPSDLEVNKPSENDTFEMLKNARAVMSESIANLDSPTIKFEPGLDDHQSVIFADDFEDADFTNANWDIQNYGGNTSWGVAPTSDTTNVLLYGDFDNGYLDNSMAVAWSPVFDLSVVDANNQYPAYMMIDLAAELEECCDDFWIDAWVDGQVTNLAATWFDASLKDGQYRTLYLDLSQFVGASNLQIALAAQTDGSVIGGFGVLVDNVTLIAEDYPFAASSSEGILAVGESETISVTVDSDRLPAGDWVLETVLFGNQEVSYYNPFLPFHVTTFQSRNVNLSLDPEYQDLGIVSNEEPTIFSFDAVNTGSLPVEYYSGTYLMYETPESFNAAQSSQRSSSDARESFRDPSDAPFSFDPNSHKDLILSGLSQRSGTKGVVKSGSDLNRFVGSIEAQDIYFEDFEGGVVPEGWDIIDLSYGLGSTFEVENIGSEEFPNHVLDVSDVSENGIFILNNTTTLAFSPSFDLSVVDVSENARARVGFNFLLEPGYDFGSIWIGFSDENGTYLNYVAGTDTWLPNNGNEWNLGIPLHNYAGYEDVFFAFLVETDGGGQSAWAYFDNIDVFTWDKTVYASSTEGVIDSAATETFDVTVNSQWLYPGNYAAITWMDYYSNDVFVSRYTEQYTSFEIENEAPIAEDDTLAILAGDWISVDDLMSYILSNDSDEYNQLWLYDVSDPLYGSIKYPVTDESLYYVAPLNYDGWDVMEYIVTDGNMMDTAVVYISVQESPSFVKGSDQQYVFLEDNELSLSTVGMAAGVGGQNPDIMVWAESGHESVFMDHDGDSHTMQLSADENFFGQITAMFYVGEDGFPEDSMEVSIVVIPVNDAPTAEFSVEVDGSQITLSDASNDDLDLTSGGIVKWEWDFGDGNTSEDRNPSHDFGDVGEFNVTLKVTDNGGLSSMIAETVTITTVSNEELEGIPTEFSIDQNYPNPFNPSTVINYSVPEASKVSIVVYDMLGQKVADLVNSEQSVGKYSVTFDASGLSSGVYIYQLRAGTFSQTKKMLLIK